MDKTDAIGGHRFLDDTSADSEIQRTLTLLNQKDGFYILHRVKMTITPNWPDTLHPGILEKYVLIYQMNEHD